MLKSAGNIRQKCRSLLEWSHVGFQRTIYHFSVGGERLLSELMPGEVRKSCERRRDYHVLEQHRRGNGLVYCGIYVS